MLPRVLCITAPCRLLSQSGKLLHHKISPKKIGISLVRTHEKDEEECAYPSFRQFNVETQDRHHSFSVSCDRAIKFIKLGAINKQIGVQYCHYLAELCRNSETPEDAEYYGSRCGDLTQLLLRNEKDVPALARTRLLSDVADTTKENCRRISSKLIEQGNFKYGFRKQDFAQLIGACCKRDLWNEANKLMAVAPANLLTFRISESLVHGVINAANNYKNLDAERRKELRSSVITTLKKLCQLSVTDRVQLITKQKKEFIQALENLDLKTRINPVIKLSGRCTGCNTHLPIFDHKLVSVINASIKSQLYKGAERGIFLNTSPNDVHRFEEFLQNLYLKDKRPLDCVIDGLNIAYRNSTGYNVIQKQLSGDVSKSVKVPKPENQARVLINCIIRGDLLKNYRKILVVGKWHMTRWPGLMDFFQEHGIHFYSSYNNSKDDLFQLFAATLNPKTVLATNDFLRDHLAQLDEGDRTLMERWIDTHQMWICQKTLKPILPTPFEKIPCVSLDGNVLHLPVIDYNQLDAVGVYEPPPHLNSKILTWVCCDIRDEVSQADAVKA